MPDWNRCPCRTGKGGDSTCTNPDCDCTGHQFAEWHPIELRWVPTGIDRTRPGGPRVTWLLSAQDVVLAPMLEQARREGVTVRPRPTRHMPEAENAEQQNVRLTALIAEGNIRELDRDSPEFKELVEDVKTRGILEPVLVRPAPGKEGQFELVAGFRRVAAARGAGLLEIPARVMALNDSEVAEVRLVENLQRKDLSPIEEARAFAKFAELTHAKPKEIGNRISKSSSYVTARLGLLKLPESVVKLIDTGRLPPSHAEILTRLPDDDQGHQVMATLAKQAVQWRTPVTEFNQAVSREAEAIGDQRKLQSLRDTAKVPKCPVEGKPPSRYMGESAGAGVKGYFYAECGHYWHPETGKQPKWQLEAGKYRAKNERDKTAHAKGGGEPEEEEPFGLVAPTLRSPHGWRKILDTVLDGYGEERVVGVEIRDDGSDTGQGRIVIHLAEGKNLLRLGGDYDSAHVGLFPVPYTTGHKTQVMAVTEGTDDDDRKATLDAWAKFEKANLPAVKLGKLKEPAIEGTAVAELLKPNMAEVEKNLPDDGVRDGKVEDPLWREKLELIRAVEVEGRDRKGVLLPLDRALRGPCGSQY